MSEKFNEELLKQVDDMIDEISIRRLFRSDHKNIEKIIDLLKKRLLIYLINDIRFKLIYRLQFSKGVLTGPKSEEDKNTYYVFNDEIIKYQYEKLLFLGKKDLDYHYDGQVKYIVEILDYMIGIYCENTIDIRENIFHSDPIKITYKIMCPELSEGCQQFTFEDYDIIENVFKSYIKIFEIPDEYKEEYNEIEILKKIKKIKEKLEDDWGVYKTISYKKTKTW